MPRWAKTGCRILKRVAGWCPAESPRKSTLSLGGSAAVAGAARIARARRANRMRVLHYEPPGSPRRMLTCRKPAGMNPVARQLFHSAVTGDQRVRRRIVFQFLLGVFQF